MEEQPTEKKRKLMHRKYNIWNITTAIFLILVMLSLACSLAGKVTTPPKPTSTRKPTIPHLPSKTSTRTRLPTRTSTSTTSPTPTKTTTPTYTHTPAYTITSSPTTTRSATPTPTLSQAETLLFMAEKAMQSVDTLSMNITLTIRRGLLPVTLIGNGVAERPDKVYTKLWLLFQNIEILSIGSDEIYLKPLDSNIWERTSPNQMDLPTALLCNAFNLLEVSDTAINPVLLATEEVNGVMCNHLNMGVDLPRYLAKRVPAASSQINLVTSRARIELWTGISDFRVHKLYIDMQLYIQEEEYPVLATIKFSEFNNPVKFPSTPSIP